MNATLIAFMSIGLYGLGTLYEAITQIKRSRSQNALPLISGLVAATLHATALISLSTGINIDHFTLVNSAAIITCLAAIILALISFKHPTQSMLLFVYPLAIASVIALLFADQQYDTSAFNTGILIHIALSIISYTVLSLAAIQAILVVVRNRNLKSHHKNHWLNKLPPLLEMERILFDLIRIGTLILGGAIVAGFMFVDNLFAQHLVHKTFFSIVAFMLYATLLIGRHSYGWRGELAASLTLWGTGSLMLGFFGTKLVLEAFIQ